VSAEAFEFALLSGVATFTVGISLRVSVVRPHAVATSSCVALWVAKLVGGPRVAVAAYVLWPGVAAFLLSGVATPGGVGARPPGAGREVLLVSEPPAWSGWFATVATVVLVVYALALARWGAYLTPWWPWPLLLPNVAPALALWLGRRPRSWSERATYVLPASAFADAVTTWAGAPSSARAAVGCVTWAAFGCMIVACAVRPSARG
jgi:hypothetical protein